MTQGILEQVPGGSILDRCPQRPGAARHSPFTRPGPHTPVWPIRRGPLSRPMWGTEGRLLLQHPLAKVRWGVGDGRAHPPGNVSLHEMGEVWDGWGKRKRSGLLEPREMELAVAPVVSALGVTGKPAKRPHSTQRSQLTRASCPQLQACSPPAQPPCHSRPPKCMHGHTHRQRSHAQH